MTESTRKELAAIARELRGQIVAMSHRTGAPHVGSSLSCVDIVVAAYWQALRIDPQRPQDPDRDRFIMSKGHAAATLYAALAARGFFPAERLAEYTKDGADLPEHPILGCIPGVEVTTGSLGHGLSMGLGMALAAKITARDYRVVVLMSDGECNEGSVWEAAQFAGGRHLDRVTAIVDFNKWQATGRSEEVMALAPLADKWRSFGWSTYEVDGHDPAAVAQILKRVPDGSGKPVAVIAHTIKGKGVSFMEDDNNWHYRIPTAEEVTRAHRELGLL